MSALRGWLRRQRAAENLAAYNLLVWDMVVEVNRAGVPHCALADDAGRFHLAPCPPPGRHPDEPRHDEELLSIPAHHPLA